MFGTSSGTAPDYHELNAGAHRKPPKVLSAPSLVWHLAFWTSFPELDAQREPVRNADGSVRKKDSQEIRDGLDQYIIALGKAIAEQMRRGNEPKSDPAGSDADGEADIHGRDDGVRLTPCISGAYLLFGHAYAVETLNRLKPDLLDPRQKDIFESTTRTVALQFVWRQLDVSIRFEVRTEYFTISTFVELDRNRVKARDKKAMSSIQELKRMHRKHSQLPGTGTSARRGASIRVRRILSGAGQRPTGRTHQQILLPHVLENLRTRNPVG
jgi:hypothetical protein